jgi:hypothetical protein
VDVEALIGRPWQLAPNGGPVVDGLDAVRRVFTRYDHLLGDSEEPPPGGRGRERSGGEPRPSGGGTPTRRTGASDTCQPRACPQDNRVAPSQRRWRSCAVARLPNASAFPRLSRRRARRSAGARAVPRVRSTGAYVLPVANYRLTAGFGESGSRWTSSHTRQDFAAPSGTAVRAVSGGVVTSAEWAGAYGWRVIIRHLDGTETWYCHLSSFAVRRGSVEAGQVIGRVGSTGNSTGPHLHLEVRVNDVPIDPMPWLRSHGMDPDVVSLTSSSAESADAPL